MQRLYNPTSLCLGKGVPRDLRLLRPSGLPSGDIRKAFGIQVGSCGEGRGPLAQLGRCLWEERRVRSALTGKSLAWTEGEKVFGTTVPMSLHGFPCLKGPSYLDKGAFSIQHSAFCGTDNEPSIIGHLKMRIFGSGTPRQKRDFGYGLFLQYLVGMLNAECSLIQ